MKLDDQQNKVSWNKGQNEHMKHICILQLMSKENKRLMEFYPLLNKSSNFNMDVVLTINKSYLHNTVVTPRAVLSKVWFPTGVRSFVSLQNVQNSSETHLSSY
jgi:hypothetical protein